MGLASTHAYLATPASRGGRPALVLHEWWGLDDPIRDVCDRLAGEGLVALAPDLYHGEVTSDPGEAGRLMGALDLDRVRSDVRAAIEWLDTAYGRHDVGVAVIGFSLGGEVALWAASWERSVNAVIDYYHVLPHGTPEPASLTVPVLGHFGEADQIAPLADARALEQALRDAGVDVTFAAYEGAGHAFLNDRAPTYNLDAATLSWKRTLEFLRSRPPASSP